MDQNWGQYEWIVVVSAVFAFITAYGIGANDVANAFATSVGAKALTVLQAVIIAGIFEFAGAVLLGASVTDTIRKNVAETSDFREDPEVLMYGMMCVIASTGLWLILASYLELPVSTTHSVIGGIIGMALAAHGASAIVWFDFDEDKEALKKFTGVAPIIVSWVISPVLSALLAVFLFWFVRTFILHHARSRERAFIFFPFLVGLTIALNVYFIIYKGFQRDIGKNDEKVSDILGAGWSTLIALGLGTAVGGLVWFLFIPWLRNRVADNVRRRERQNGSAASSAGLSKTASEEIPQHRDAFAALNRVMEHDLYGVINTDKDVRDIYHSSESFDPGTEESFKYLQVFTATMDSFAHGANDVANAMGPFAAIWDIYRHHDIKGDKDKSPVPEWILVIGGAGIVLGLATYGYNIMRAIGVKLVKMSASRGFAIELGAATVIVVGSRYGIPLSTTHCQVGATVGVGLMEGKKGVNVLLLMKVIAGWIITLVVVGVTSALFFVQGVYAPSIPNLRYIKRYSEGLLLTVTNMTDFLRILGDPERATQLLDEFTETTTIRTDQSSQQVAVVDETYAAVEGFCMSLLQSQP